MAKGARAARIQRNKMVRDQKRAALLKEKRASAGSCSPPRVIVLFGLSDKVNVSLLTRDLVSTLDPQATEVVSATVSSPAYRLRTTILEAPRGDLLACMEMAKVADLIAFVASGCSFCDADCDSGSCIDSFGSHCLSLFRSLGLPNTAVLIRDLPTDLRRRQEVKKMCMSSVSSELPEDCKFYLADTKEDLHKFMWLYKEQNMSVPHWRHHRPYLLAQKVSVECNNSDTGTCSLLLSGYVRARNFSVNQLVHVSGAGDFQLSKIDVLADPFPLRERKNSDLMESNDVNEVVRTILPDTSKLEPLIVENIPDPLAGEQTWPTEAEMAEADVANRARKTRKKLLPKGTSDYQAAWIIDETDDENSDSDVDGEDGMVLDEENNEQIAREGSEFSDEGEEPYSVKDIENETDADTVMADDDNMTKEQIEAEIQRIKAAHDEDEEFPDEVDTPLDVPARKRFARFRGLKSFRTSSWDPKESLPAEYARIFAFDNFRRTQKHVFSHATKIDQGSIEESASAGSYVQLSIKHVPVHVASKLCSVSTSKPILASGLFQHESKMSVLHFSIKKHDSYEAPIKSKETLIFNLGFRQFVARPVFSSDNLNSDKHKMERFLHPGSFSIASVYAPISFPPLPLIVFKSSQEGHPVVAATGSLRTVDPDRIILKKIILTGYPQRVSKLKATVRFMFHNPDDVRWFKPVELFTKNGRRGRVKEPVGTHGAMKCVFNGVVQQHDTVCMNLYKRVYPKWPESIYGVMDK